MGIMPKLFWSSLRLIYRDKQALFWALAFPVIFAVVFGLFDFTRRPDLSVALAASKASPVAQSLEAGLKKAGSFKVYWSNEVTARRDLKEGRVNVVLVVPNSGPPAQAAPQRIQFLYSGRNADRNQYASSAIGQVVDAANLKLAGVSEPPLVVDPKAVSAKTIDYFDFLLPGLVGMGVMNFAIVGMAVALARFREQRILRRILATPLRPIRFLVAQVSARLLLSLVQAALILAVGVFLLGAHVYGNVAWVFVLVTAANLIFLNIGFAVAGRSPTSDAAQGVGAVVAIPMMFLSGVFFPPDSLPRAMASIVRYLPLTPLIAGMRKVVLDGASLAGTMPELALLGAWIVVSFIFAACSFRFGDA
jgi:ABC-2 type transport system permease protein